MKLNAPKDLAVKTAYAAVGAPVVIGRKMRDFGTKFVSDAQTQFEAFADEGEQVTSQLKNRNVVEELEQRINIDKVQGRVEQLRDQLESTLHSWRESFAPDAKPEPAAAAKKPAAKKAPAKKAAAKKPAAKKPAAKKPAAKKTTAKATATK